MLEQVLWIVALVVVCVVVYRMMTKGASDVGSCGGSDREQPQLLVQIGRRKK